MLGIPPPAGLVRAETSFAFTVRHELPTIQQDWHKAPTIHFRQLPASHFIPTAPIQNGWTMRIGRANHIAGIVNIEYPTTKNTVFQITASTFLQHPSENTFDVAR